MPKQRINVTIDNDLYLLSKVRLTNGELSGRINDFLRDFLEAQEEEGDEAELMDEIQQLQEERRSVQEKLATVSVRLAQVRHQREQQEQEEAEMHRKILAMDEQSGILRDLEN